MAANNISPLLLEAAHLMRKHKIHRLEDLLSDEKLANQLGLTEQGKSLLHDLRKHSARGLEDTAKRIAERAKAPDLNYKVSAVPPRRPRSPKEQREREQIREYWRSLRSGSKLRAKQKPSNL